MKDWTWVEKRSWQWPDGEGVSGVHTFEGQLVWWNRPGGDGGRFGEGASTQTFDEFIADGPPVFVPANVLSELRAILKV